MYAHNCRRIAQRNVHQEGRRRDSLLHVGDGSAGQIIFAPLDVPDSHVGRADAAEDRRGQARVHALVERGGRRRAGRRLHRAGGAR